MQQNGYSMANGRWANTLACGLAASASHAATFTTDAIELGDRGTARLTLDVTVGTGTLDVAIQTSADGSTWRAVASFTQATGVTTERKSFTGIDRFIKAVCTIGTGPFTFSIDGEAV
jgi:hypothetical protein